MGIKQLREEEKGSGLVLTLMVLLVLSVLGIAIGTLTIGSYRLSDATRDDTSSYYVAEAGAVAAYEEIQNKVLSAYKNSTTEESFYAAVSNIMKFKDGKPIVRFDKQFGSRPSVKILTKKDSSQKYSIYSTGKVDGKERTVTKPITVKWINKNTGGGLPKLPVGRPALLTEGTIDIQGDQLIGDIHTNSKSQKSIIITGNPNLNDTTLYYPSGVDSKILISKPNDWIGLETQIASKEAINFNSSKEIIKNITAPNITKKIPVETIGSYTVQDEEGNLNITNELARNYELKLESDVYIPKMVSNGNINFSINTGKSDHTILVDDLNISGDISIKGEGTLTIIIKKSFIISGGSKFNVEKNHSQPTLIYLSNGMLNLINGTKINAHMIVKEANINIGGGSSINGILLTGGSLVDFSGGNESNTMLIAPIATVTLTGGQTVKGTIIARNFKMNGGSILTYASVDTAGFPFGLSGTVSVPKPEEIINSGTIVED